MLDIHKLANEVKYTFEIRAMSNVHVQPEFIK